ncbi:MAG: DUF2948 family protein [Pseudomonadota bacterium]
MAQFKPMALVAADSEDLQAVSALLQDAVLKIGDATYLDRDRRFAFVTNRYVWEAPKAFFGRGQRVRTGVHFDDVISVKTKNLRLDAKDAVVEILSTEYDGDENGGLITINLAGGGAIALEVEAINASLNDLSEPWQASRRPNHEGV